MDSRKSSILKQKIRVPLQEVMLPDFPDDETVTTTVTKSRRVSFGTNLVKEFIVGSAVSTQCVSEYEQAFSSSDSSNTNSSRSVTGSHLFEQSTFSSRENLRMSSDGHALNLTMNRSHVNTENISVSVKNTSDKSYEFEVDKKQLSARSDVLKQSKNLTDLHLGPEKVNKHDDSRLSRGKCGKFSSTICFSADSPTADMEFTEGCINLAKSILDKKKKAITVFIQAKPKEEEVEPEGDETYVFETSDAEMSITKCVKADKSIMDVDDFNESDVGGEKLFLQRNDSISDEETDENAGEIWKKALELDADTDKSLFSPKRKLSDVFYFPENDSMDLSSDSPFKNQSRNFPQGVGMELTNCVVAQKVEEKRIETTMQTSAMDFTKCVRNDELNDSKSDSVNMSITENFVEGEADLMEETPCKKIPLNRSHPSFGAEDLSSEPEDSMELTECLSVPNIPSSQDVSKLFSLPVEAVEEEKVKIDSLDDSSSGLGSSPKRDSVDSFVGGLFNGNGRNEEMDVDVSVKLDAEENVGLDLTKHVDKEEELNPEKDAVVEEVDTSVMEDDEKENEPPEKVSYGDENDCSPREENPPEINTEVEKRMSMKDSGLEFQKSIVLPEYKEVDTSKMDVSAAQELEEMSCTKIVEDKVEELEEAAEEKTLTPDNTPPKNKEAESSNMDVTMPVPEDLEITNKTMNFTNVLSSQSPGKPKIPFPKESTPLKDIEVRRMNLTGIIPKITPQKISFDDNDITKGPLCTSLKVFTDLDDLKEVETPSPSILPMKDLASPTMSVPGFDKAQEEKIQSEDKNSNMEISGVAEIDQGSVELPENIQEKEMESSNMAVDVPEGSLVQEENAEVAIASVPESDHKTDDILPEILSVGDEDKNVVESNESNLNFTRGPEAQGKNLSRDEESLKEKSLNVTNNEPEKPEVPVENKLDESAQSEKSQVLNVTKDLGFVPSPKPVNVSKDLGFVPSPKPANIELCLNVTKDLEFVSSPKPASMELDDSFIPEKDIENAKTDLEEERLVHAEHLKDNDNDQLGAVLNESDKVERNEPEVEMPVSKDVPFMPSPKPANPVTMELDDSFIPKKITNNSAVKMDFNSSQPIKISDKSTNEPENDIKDNSRSTSVNFNSNTITLNTDSPHNDRTAATFTVTPRNTTYVVPNHTFVLETEKLETPKQPEPEKSPKLESSIKAAVKRPSLEMSPCPNTSQNKKHRLSSDFNETGIRLVTDHSFNEMDSVTLDDMDDKTCTQVIQPNDNEPKESEPAAETTMEVDLNSKSINGGHDTSSGDGKIIETLTEQSKESDCLWKIKGFKNSNADDEDLWSFSFDLLNSCAVIDFKLKISSDGVDSYSDIIDSQISLIHDDEYLTSKYLTVIDFGFNKMKKYFDCEKKIETVRHIPYFLDIFNSFTTKINNYLKQILAILKQYPGSQLINDTLSFRLFSFPVLFSSMIIIDLKNLFRLSKDCISFDIHFGELNKNQIKDVFEESLKYENCLIDFIISSTKYVIRLELETGRVSKRDHIQLLPDYLKL